MKKVVYSDQLASRRRRTCRPAGSLIPAKPKNIKRRNEE
jgi:hypothetical protein